MQATLENEGSEAVKKLKAAAKTEKELRHQLGKVRFAAKEFEDSYNLIYRTREEALAKVRKAWLFFSLNPCKSHLLQAKSQHTVAAAIHFLTS